MDYEAPTVADYGDLLELTRGVGTDGVEDGTCKSTPAPHPGGSAGCEVSIVQ